MPSRRICTPGPQRIVRADGLLRMVFGLGTRAVERIGPDYPRMVPLSHPLLRPEASAEEIRKYSQKLVDVLDLKSNSIVTHPGRGPSPDNRSSGPLLHCFGRRRRASFSASFQKPGNRHGPRLHNFRQPSFQNARGRPYEKNPEPAGESIRQGGRS